MADTKLTLGNETVSSESGDFELVLQVRNHKGEPTGRTKSLRHEEASKIADFWHRMTGKPKQKKRRKPNKQDKLPSRQEAERILREINKE